MTRSEPANGKTANRLSTPGSPCKWAVQGARMRRKPVGPGTPTRCSPGSKSENGERIPIRFSSNSCFRPPPRNGTPELLNKDGAFNHSSRDSLRPANPSAPPLLVNYLPTRSFHNGHVELRDEVGVDAVWERRENAQFGIKSDGSSPAVN